MRSNISDHSCHHYARQLLALIAGRGGLGGAEPSRLAAVFRDEIALNAELIGAHPGSESLWLHRRFLLVAATDPGHPRLGAADRPRPGMQPDAEMDFARPFAAASIGWADRYIVWMCLQRKEHVDTALAAACCAAASRRAEAEPYHARLYAALSDRIGATGVDAGECTSAAATTVRARQK